MKLNEVKSLSNNELLIFLRLMRRNAQAIGQLKELDRKEKH